MANGSSAILRSNRSTSNLLGGFSVEGEDTVVVMEGNIAENNKNAGIVIDKLSTVKSYVKNTAKGNAGEQERLKADLPERAEPAEPAPPALDAPPPKAR